jgi:hypothetical protein
LGLGFGYGVNVAMTKVVRALARCLHDLPENLSARHGILKSIRGVAR